MPITASTVLVGHIVASLVRNLVATALVVAVGLAVGRRPTGSVSDWLAAVTVVVLFVPYLSTAFVPADTMPAEIRGIAAHQPFTPVVETMRGRGHEASLAVAYCLVILAVSALAATRLFRRELTGR